MDFSVSISKDGKTATITAPIEERESKSGKSTLLVSTGRPQPVTVGDKELKLTCILFEPKQKAKTSKMDAFRQAIKDLELSELIGMQVSATKAQRAVISELMEEKIK